MRVCFDLTPLCTVSRLRGIGTYVLGLARGFAAAGDLLEGLELFLMHPSGHAMRVVPYDGSWLNPDTLFDGNEILSDPYYFFLKRTRALFTLTRARMDLFHSTWPKGTPHALRCKTIATCHDLIPVLLKAPFDPPVLPRRLRRVVEQMRYYSMDQVIAVSQWTKTDVVRLLHYPEDRVSVIYNGIDQTLFHPRPARGEKAEIVQYLGSDRPYFFYIGGSDPRKQVPHMIEAFCLARDNVDENMVVAGAMSPSERQTVSALVHRMGATDRVIILDHVEQELVPKLYRQATAHTMFSLHEGFGLTIVEAFACGCPVVALDVSCIAEISQDAALLIEPNSLAAISAGLIQMGQDHTLRNTAHARGLERAKAFSWNHCARETVALYRQILSE